MLDKVSLRRAALRTSESCADLLPYNSIIICLPKSAEEPTVAGERLGWMCLEAVDPRGLHHRKSHFGISMLPSSQVNGDCLPRLSPSALTSALILALPRPVLPPDALCRSFTSLVHVVAG